MALHRLVCVSLRKVICPEVKMGNTAVNVNFKQTFGSLFKISCHFVSHSIGAVKPSSPILARFQDSIIKGARFYKHFSTSSHLCVLDKKKGNRPEKIVEAKSPSEMLKQIQNQEVKVFDDKNLFIRVMTLKMAEETAGKAGFTLIEMKGEKKGQDGMKAYKYVTRKELFQITMERKREKLKSKKGTKEVIVSTTIDGHDFKTKMDQVREFLDDSIPVKVKIVSKKFGSDQETKLGKTFRRVVEELGTGYVVEEAASSKSYVKIMFIKSKNSPSDSRETQPVQDVKKQSTAPSGDETIVSGAEDHGKSG